MTRQFIVALVCIFISHFAFSGEADVIGVKVRHNGGDSYQILTTVKHSDKGWDHYANGWEVLNEQGEVIGKRTLHHPHVKEQPFTRSLTLTIPKNIRQIRVRAFDSVHGGGGQEVVAKLPGR